MNNENNKNHDLEDHIPLLRKLDEMRTRSAKLRDEGVDFLININPCLFGEDQRLEKSLVVRALLKRQEHPLSNKDDEEKRQKRIENLTDNIQIRDLTNEQKELGLTKLDLLLVDQNNSILTAASMLRALVAEPGGVFKETAMLCYYWIIRELYTADSRNWAVGGARAGCDGQANAFCTSECLRAILSFRRTMTTTGEFFEAVGEYKKKKQHLEDLTTTFKEIDNEFSPWVETEKKRLALSYALKLKQLSRFLVLNLLDNTNNDQTAEDFIDTIIKNIESYQEQLERDKLIIRFESAITSIEDYREKERKTPELIKHIHKSESAHQTALKAVVLAKNNLDESIKAFFKAAEKDNPVYEYVYSNVEEGLKQAAKQTDSLLNPVKHYLSSVIDREISLYSLQEYCDTQPSELVCAAASYSRLTKEWENDLHFHRAISDLSNMISRRGQFVNSRPVYKPKDFDKSQLEDMAYLQSMAQFLRQVNEDQIDHDLLVAITEKMLRFFEEWEVDFEKWRKTFKEWEAHYKQLKGESNNTPDDDKKNMEEQKRAKPKIADSANAIMALSEINKMLDVRINKIVLEHFSVKRKDTGLNSKLTLDTLFYPDYGLLSCDEEYKKIFSYDEFKRISPDTEIKKEDWPGKDCCREQSVAITLQRLRGHISRVMLPKMGGIKIINSLVLHGPAGTGKTTMIEALAVTCDVPLVEITPSDLVKEGEENIEKRARDVFYALSLLTRVVILFDEFDPVLKRRDFSNDKQLNVFSFLTPGMLPKLKSLHDSAEKRSVAYALVTNLIGTLDEAAVRQGRFDERIGVYPPDLLSRTGRFLNEVKAYIDLHNELYKKEPNKKITLNDPHLNRICEIIQETKGKGMTALGRPGWFTKPKENKDKLISQTPFDFFLNEHNLTTWPEPDDNLKGILGTGRSAVTECLQWAWVRAWDSRLDDEEGLKKKKPKIYTQNTLKVALSKRPSLEDIAEQPLEYYKPNVNNEDKGLTALGLNKYRGYSLKRIMHRRNRS